VPGGRSKRETRNAIGIVEKVEDESGIWCVSKFMHFSIRKSVPKVLVSKVPGPLSSCSRQLDSRALQGLWRCSGGVGPYA